MIWNVFLVAIGGCCGALARYILSQQISKRFPSHFPFATFFINLSGSFLLGLITGANSSSNISLLFGTGFMGAYTTFSTFNFESIQLGIKKNWGTMVSYIGFSYVFGILLALLGFCLGTKGEGWGMYR